MKIGDCVLTPEGTGFIVSFCGNVPTCCCVVRMDGSAFWAREFAFWVSDVEPL